MRRSPICNCGHPYTNHHYVEIGDTDPCDSCACNRFESSGWIET